MEVFYVYWSSYDLKYKRIIGFLIHDDLWYFKYNNNIEETIKLGFRPFPDMNDIDKIYESKDLFLTFKNRYKDIKLMKSEKGELITDKIMIKYIKERV